MLEAEISPAFWKACMFLEAEATKLIDIEAKYVVTDEEKEAIKRLNYYFYELVYMWANKESFLKIKHKYPNVEEGIMIKMIFEVKKICKLIKEMAILIGDNSLG